MRPSIVATALAFPLAFAPAVLLAQDPPEWTRPTAPFRIVGPVWYVGTAGLASYLIKTPGGAILIDGTMAQNVPAIRRNIASLGVPIRRVKLLLLTHAHFDHAAGLAGLKRASGAKLVVGAGDAAAVRTGTPPGETSYGVIRFPAAPVDRAIHDGETVTLGGTTLTAVATPGHTPGCTSWTMRVIEKGRPLAVIFPCSLSVAGNRLVGNRAYPEIVRDFRKSFDRIGAMKADVVLTAHPELADVIARHRDGRGYVAPGLLQHIVAEARAAFSADLAKQTNG